MFASRRRIVTSVLLVALIAVLSFGSVGVYADTPPVVDGALFGPGDGTTRDRDTYSAAPIQNVLRPVTNETIGWVYEYYDGAGTYYVAMSLDANYCDNVFDDGFTTYLGSVGWDQQHWFKQLVKSDRAQFQFTCDGTSTSWYQTLVDDCSDIEDPRCTADGGWQSSVDTPPAELQEWATSEQWSMDNTGWDVSQGSTDYRKWKSPDTDPSSSPTNLGHGTTWYDSLHKWEWLIIYEMSFDVSGCTTYSIEAVQGTDPDGSDGVHASPDKGLPAAVTLASFTATPQGKAVLLEWETVTEIDNLRFFIHRAESTDGPRTRINDDVIPSQTPGGPVGATYEFLDESVAAGTIYYYWLEDVESTGVRGFHGPVSAKVGDMELYRLLPPPEPLH